MKNAYQVTNPRSKNLCDFVAWCAFHRLSSKALALAVSMIVLGLFGLGVASRPWNMTAIPDTLETHKVIAALERAYQVLDTPFTELDLKQLSEVTDLPNCQYHYHAKAQGAQRVLGSPFAFFTPLREFSP